MDVASKNFNSYLYFLKRNANCSTDPNKLSLCYIFSSKLVLLGFSHYSALFDIFKRYTKTATMIISNTTIALPTTDKSTMWLLF